MKLTVLPGSVEVVVYWFWYVCVYHCMRMCMCMLMYVVLWSGVEFCPYYMQIVNT